MTVRLLIDFRSCVGLLHLPLLVQEYPKPFTHLRVVPRHGGVAGPTMTKHFTVTARALLAVP